MAEPSTSPNQNTTTTATTTATPSSWGTLEELLLACAVHRYGTNSWDSIAKELQNHTPTATTTTNSSTFSLFTPHICQQKYRDLKRRFAADFDPKVDDTPTATAAAASNLWLDELRRLRVAELRRELQRYDLSIVSLQLKVKKLKEERETSVKDEIKEEEENQSDLQKIQEGETPINALKTEPSSPTKSEPVEPEIMEPDRVDEPAGEDGLGDSCNGSSNSKEEERERRERVDSGELVESVAESKDHGGDGGGGGGGEREEGVMVKENSDVQSTASVWRNENDEDENKNKNKNKSNNRREKKVGVVSGNTSSGEENHSWAVKSEALAEFLEIVRARKLGSFFERRLESQETPKYTSLIKQHIDLGIIQRRLEEGQYMDCHTKFYRDLMILINNAIIFFTKISSEHKAALELRQLLNKKFQSNLWIANDKSHPSKPVQPAHVLKPTKPEANPADRTDPKPKLTITGPVIACKKRSSIAGKSSRGGEKKEPLLMTPTSEKPCTLREMVKQQGEKTSSTSFNAVTKKRTRDQSLGSRSSSSKNNNRNPSPSTPVSGKGESSEAKADKKKPSPGNSSNKTKQGLGSGKNLLLESLKNSDRRKSGHDNNGASGNSDRRKDERPQNGSVSKTEKEKAKGKEERESPATRSNRRPPKRAAAIAAVGKRGCDGGGGTESQSKKRQRK